MKIWQIFPLILILAACSTPKSNVDYPTLGSAPKLDDLGKAPELTNEIWLNTDQPLRLADLQGQVVLLDMWTYS